MVRAQFSTSPISYDENNKQKIMRYAGQFTNRLDLAANYLECSAEILN